MLALIPRCNGLSRLSKLIATPCRRCPIARKEHRRAGAGLRAALDPDHRCRDEGRASIHHESAWLRRANMVAHSLHAAASSLIASS
jgi:hypothetical protein